LRLALFLSHRLHGLGLLVVLRHGALLGFDRILLGGGGDRASGDELDQLVEAIAFPSASR
jgi:hypothetical protein